MDFLDLSVGGTLNHLQTLERHKLVVVHLDGHYKRYFPANEFDEPEKKIISALRRKTSFAIVKALVNDGSATQRKLTKVVGISGSTVSWHLGHLIEQGIVHCERNPLTENIYSVADMERINSLIGIMSPAEEATG